MTVSELTTLRAIDRLEGRDEYITKQTITYELAVVGKVAESIGYQLRSLAKRGWIEVAGRRHGGCRKWRLTADGARAARG